MNTEIFDLGKIGITLGYEYDDKAIYEKLTIVLYKGKSYISTKTTQGVSPEQDVKTWQLVAEAKDAYHMLVDAGKTTLTEEEFLEQLVDATKGRYIVQGNVINEADEEDLTVEHSFLLGIDTLKLANRPSTNGMGYVILRKNKTFAEQVTKENTIYEIRYDFDLEGTEVTIPKGCILKFEGGKLKNTKLTLANNCTIKNGHIQIAHEGYINLDDKSNIEGCTFNCVDYCYNGKGVLYADSKKDIIISNCLFNKQTRPASSNKCSSIDLRNCDNFLINKVISYYSEGENIFIQDGNGIISNTVTYEGWSGIGTGHFNSSLDHPVLKGDGKSSIVISNNIVINAIAAGITINTDNTICSNNTVVWQGKDEEHIVQMMGPGIRIGHSFAHANNCLIDGNIIRWGHYCTNTGDSTSDRGISIDAGDNNVIQNNYIEHTKTGIGSSVTQKSGTVIRNNYMICQVAGITIYKDLTSTIETNDILIEDVIDNNGVGITVTHGHHVIKNNRIRYKKDITELPDMKDYTCLGIYVIMDDSDIIIEENDIFSRRALCLEGNAVTKCLSIKNNTLISTKEFRINVPSYKLICENNHIISSSILAAPISYIIGNIIEECENSVLRLEICENYIIMNNYFSTTAAYAISAYFADISKIKKVVLHNNISKSATSLIQSSTFETLKGKLNVGYLPGFDNYETHPYFVNRNGKIIDALGFTNTTRKGTTGQRPNLIADDSGFDYYDTILKKKILWNGNEWVNLDGTSLN